MIKKKLSPILLMIFCFLWLDDAQAQLALKFSNGYFSEKYATPYFLSTFSTFQLGIATTSNIKTPQQNLPGPYVPMAYNYHELAFFCKLEVKMEKSAKLPIKVRLGDVDYVDWLEGKRMKY